MISSSFYLPLSVVPSFDRRQRAFAGAMVDASEVSKEIFDLITL